MCDMAREEIRVECKSVFASPEDGCRAARLTQKWIEVIRAMEKREEGVKETAP